MRSLLFFTLIFFVPNFLASPINQNTTPPYAPPDPPKTPRPSGGPSDAPTYYYPPDLLAPGFEFDLTRRWQRPTSYGYKPEVGDIFVTRRLPGIDILPPKKGKFSKMWTLVIARIQYEPSKSTDSLAPKYECLLFEREPPKVKKPEVYWHYWERSDELFSSHAWSMYRGGYLHESGERPSTPYNIFKFMLFTIDVIDRSYMVNGIGNVAEMGRILDLVGSPPDYSEVKRILAEDEDFPPPAYSEPVKQPGPLKKIGTLMKTLTKSESGGSTGQ